MSPLMMASSTHGVTAWIWSGWMWPTLPGLCPMITSKRADQGTGLIRVQPDHDDVAIRPGRARKL
jgi:hypothetical protein